MSTALQDHRTTTSSLRALVGSIETHIARGQLSRTGFGKAAPGDASLPGRLNRGSDARPGTADKVLACMNPEPTHPRFARGVEAFLEVTGIEPHVLGKAAPGDSSFVLRLEKGQSPTLGTVDRANDWMADKARPAELEAVRSAVEDGAPAVAVIAAIHGENGRWTATSVTSRRRKRRRSWASATARWRPTARAVGVRLSMFLAPGWCAICCPTS